MCGVLRATIRAIKEISLEAIDMILDSAGRMGVFLFVITGGDPRPFAHFAKDNIQEKRLDEIFRSQFLSQLRSSDAVIRHGRLGCALLENRDILENIATSTGAKPTDRSLVGVGNSDTRGM